MGKNKADQQGTNSQDTFQKQRHQHMVPPPSQPMGSCEGAMEVKKKPGTYGKGSWDQMGPVLFDGGAATLHLLRERVDASAFRASRGSEKGSQGCPSTVGQGCSCPWVPPARAHSLFPAVANILTKLAFGVFHLLCPGQVRAPQSSLALPWHCRLLPIGPAPSRCTRDP